MARVYFYRKEIPTDPSILARYSNEQSASYQVTSERSRKYLLHLKKIRTRLRNRLMQVAKDTLTEHQQEVFVLMMKGYTYKDMSVILGINYTAIPHAIQGIKQRNDKYKGTYHGGIYKKLRKKCSKDPIIQKLLQKIHHLTRNWSKDEDEQQESWRIMTQHLR